MIFDVHAASAYAMAINEVRLQGHEKVTPEHLLYSALMFDYGKRLTRECDGNISGIMEGLQNFFRENIKKTNPKNLIYSQSFKELMERVSYDGEDKFVSLGELINAMLSLKDSHVARILFKNGFNQLKLIKNFMSDHPLKNTPFENFQDNIIKRRYTSPFDFFNEEREEFGNIKRDESEDAPEFPSFSFVEDLCASARKNDPLIGREEILQRAVAVLCRRLKNNPVFIGEPGVGKTAIVEGLAARIANGSVPKKLKDCSILRVDLSAMLAGAKYRGDFEGRLMTVLEESQKRKDVILFFDEIHTIMGAGSTSSQPLDAAAIIKPYLARGELRFIGATTFDDYKKFLERDRAIERRLQKIEVPEPNPKETELILNGLSRRYEEFHGVKIPSTLIEPIISKSMKHLNDLKLPDKALDVLDEALVTASFAGDSALNIAHIDDVIAQMAKIPVKALKKSEISRLEKELNSAVFGQQEAARKITESVQIARAGLKTPEKPIASFLFIGATGVGKTEIARTLAKVLGVSLKRFDMSEYQERHSVARLIGAPPGYIGHESGGLLTEAIKRAPHSVLLLDEIEKAHVDIYNSLLSVMDYGKLTDGTGRQTDFSNCIIIMTSNAGAQEKVIGFGDVKTEGDIKAVKNVFSPEFRNRLDAIISFNKIDLKIAKKIAKKSLDELRDLLKAQDIALKVQNACINKIAEFGLGEFGAREIRRVIQSKITVIAAQKILEKRKKNTLSLVLLENGEFALNWQK